MKRICAWCKKELSSTSSSHIDDELISHSICADCARKLLSDEFKSPLEILNKLKVPALLIQSDFLVNSANESACQSLGKTAEEISQNTGGCVMNCIYANQKGGCGNNEHCKSCTIRHAVAHTMETGEKIRKKAYPDIQFGQDQKKMCFTISTEKIDDYVLLRIEHVSEADPSDTYDQQKSGPAGPLYKTN